MTALLLVRCGAADRAATASSCGASTRSCARGAARLEDAARTSGAPRREPRAAAGRRHRRLHLGLPVRHHAWPRSASAASASRRWPSSSSRSSAAAEPRRRRRDLGRPSPTCSSPALHIVAGEQVPKIYVDRQGRGRRAALARPLRFFRRLFTPVHRRAQPRSANRILRAIGVDPDASRRGGRHARGAQGADRRSPAPAASSTRARRGCSRASSTCTSRRRAR